MSYRIYKSVLVGIILLLNLFGTQYIYANLACMHNQIIIKDSFMASVQHYVSAGEVLVFKKKKPNFYVIVNQTYCQKHPIKVQEILMFSYSGKTVNLTYNNPSCIREIPVGKTLIITGTLTYQNPGKVSGCYMQKK